MIDISWKLCSVIYGLDTLWRIRPSFPTPNSKKKNTLGKIYLDEYGNLIVSLTVEHRYFLYPGDLNNIIQEATLYRENSIDNAKTQRILKTMLALQIPFLILETEFDQQDIIHGKLY